MQRLSLLLINIFLVGLQGQEQENMNIVVSLKQGHVRGKLLNSTHGIQFNAFLGIPYGKVEKRFANPEPADPWIGILDATKDGPLCQQYDLFIRQAMVGQEHGCLVLNVYTPKLPQKEERIHLPVMVFIHGGGFSMGEGSSNIYGPELYMNKEIVLVLMNYRLGPLGFLSTGDEASPGNYGLLDQVQALRWVKENIERFGGDPDRVTISGESAGGACVIFHLLSPLSKGLFHGAIAQSGSALCPSVLQENPLNISQKIAQKVDCPIHNTTAMIECLQKVDANLLIKASDMSEPPGGISFALVPVVENSINGKFLTESPLTLLREGRINKVPVISGVTEDEAAFIAYEFLKAMSVSSPSNFTDKDWKTLLRHAVNFGLETTKLSNPQTVQAIIEKYYGDVNLDSKSNDFLLQTIQLSSDASFKSCNDKTVKLLAAAGVPVYMYVWDYAANFTNFSIGGKPVAFHAVDLFYLFNATTSFVTKYTIDQVQDFSDQILNLWSNFTTFGNPTPLEKPVKWVPVQTDRIKYLNLTTDMSMQDDYRTNNLKFWEDILYN